MTEKKILTEMEIILMDLTLMELTDQRHKALEEWAGEPSPEICTGCKPTCYLDEKGTIQGCPKAQRQS
jgi:hypothetical protein